jgi:hypothetical protein
MHIMWWKLALSAVGGFALGIALITILTYRLALQTQDMRAQYIPKQWSSAGREWPAFADWVKHGGRKLVMDAAFSTANDGMSETQVRETFGPPDLVVVGNDEFAAYRVAQMKGLGAAGAYFYKVGPFASPQGKIINDVFVIVFDSTGRTVYRMGFGTSDGDRLADIGSDTRSDRRIAP